MVNFFWPGEKGPNLRFYCFLLYEKKIGWTKKPSQEFYFVTLKNHANFGITLNAAFHISPPPKKNWSISFDRTKRVQIWDFISLFSLKGKLLKPKNLDRSFILWHWRAMESMEENRILLFKSVHQSPPPLHPPPLPTKKKKIDQFLSSGRKVPKFHILLLDFVWKENCLNQKTFTRVLLGDTKELWKVWTKTKCWFPNQHPKNWSICFQLPKRVQISTFSGFFCLKGTLLQPKTLTQVLVSDTEGLWKVWAKTEC